MKEGEVVNNKLEIKLPEGSFFGNCSDCIYANWRDVDQYGRVYCNGNYGGYNDPQDRNGCFHYIQI